MKRIRPNMASVYALAGRLNISPIEAGDALTIALNIAPSDQEFDRYTSAAVLITAENSSASKTDGGCLQGLAAVHPAHRPDPQARGISPSMYRLPMEQRRETYDRIEQQQRLRMPHPKDVGIVSRALVDLICDVVQESLFYVARRQAATQSAKADGGAQ